MASSSQDMLNLDLRMCKVGKQIGYVRKTGCVRTDCDAYYLKVGQTAKTPGPWSRGTGKTTWSWAHWNNSSTSNWAEQQRLLGALKQCKDELLASSSFEDEVDPDEAKAVGIRLTETHTNP